MFTCPQISYFQVGSPCIGRSEERHHHWAGYPKTHSSPFNHTGVPITFNPQSPFEIWRLHLHLTNIHLLPLFLASTEVCRYLRDNSRTRPFYSLHTCTALRSLYLIMWTPVPSTQAVIGSGNRTNHRFTFTT